MKADWEEILDMWEEKELAYFLPECLLDMDDAIYQRIEKQTLRRIRKERSRISRKQIALAVICLVAILGIVGREPIQAAFEKIIPLFARGWNLYQRYRKYHVSGGNGDRSF